MTPNKLTGKSSALRRGRVSVDFSAYVVTKVVRNRLPLLTRPDVAPILLESWNYLRHVDRIKLLAFCVMPDHYHLAFMLMPGERLSSVLEATNKFTSRQINLCLGSSGNFWQEGFQDRHCRSVEELHELCVYIEHNPVRAGLVPSAELWEYSSAHSERKQLLDRDWWP